MRELQKHSIPFCLASGVVLMGMPLPLACQCLDKTRYVVLTCRLVSFDLWQVTLFHSSVGVIWDMCPHNLTPLSDVPLFCIATDAVAFDVTHPSNGVLCHHRFLVVQSHGWTVCCLRFSPSKAFYVLLPSSLTASAAPLSASLAHIVTGALFSIAPSCGHLSGTLGCFFFCPGSIVLVASLDAMSSCTGSSWSLLNPLCLSPQTRTLQAHHLVIHS